MTATAKTFYRNRIFFRLYFTNAPHAVQRFHVKHMHLLRCILVWFTHEAVRSGTQLSLHRGFAARPTRIVQVEPSLLMALAAALLRPVESLAVWTIHTPQHRLALRLGSRGAFSCYFGRPIRVWVYLTTPLYPNRSRLLWLNVPGQVSIFQFHLLYYSVDVLHRCHTCYVPSQEGHGLNAKKNRPSAS